MAASNHTLGSGDSPGFFRGYCGLPVDGAAEFPFLPLGFQERPFKGEPAVEHKKRRLSFGAVGFSRRPPSLGDRRFVFLFSYGSLLSLDSKH